MIPKETIDRIMETARIEEVIGEFVNLKKAGSSYKALSPFGDEKTPSFFISPAKQIFKDFSSGKGGNVVTFLMEHDHLSYPDALRWLAKKYNIEIVEEGLSDEQLEQQNERESLYIVNQFAETYFAEQLWDTPEGRSIGLSYFRERGFTDDTIKKFQLGWAPEGWENLLNAAKAKGYKEEYLLSTGLAKKGNNGQLRDGYRARVTFPIHNISGRPIGFGARTLLSDKKVPKYINSPENPIYHKSDVLYGMFQAKADVIKYDNCYLVEGYTDVIQFYQSGVKNVVASSGTSLTKGQISLIRRYTNNVTILYDGDNAGIKASFRGIDLILEAGLNVKVVLFPDGEDPDSYAKKVSSEELKTFIEDNAKDFITFKTDLLAGEAKGDPIKLSKLIHEIVNSVALIPDLITRSIYIKECSTLLGIEEQTLLAELNKSRRKLAGEKRSPQRHDAEPPPEVMYGLELIQQQKKESTFSFEYQERDLTRLLLTFGNELIDIEQVNEETEEQEIVSVTLAEYLLVDIIEDDLEFENPAYRALIDHAIHLIEDEKPVLASEFTNHSDGLIRQTAADLLSSNYELHDWESKGITVTREGQRLKKAAQGSLYAYKTKMITKQILALQEEMKKDIPEDQLYALLKRQKQLDEIKKQLAGALGIHIIG